MKPEQLTFDDYGHMLNTTQVFSPDDKWVVYDTRNDQTQIARTCCIERVNVNDGRIERLYDTQQTSLHGPGVGAAAYHPTDNKIIFIHGLMNCSEQNPYGFTRRFGAILEDSRITSAEARVIREPLVPGALRGGTHAHSWSADGEWISFTYNDFLLERLASTSDDVKDLRTIGVMSPQNEVVVPNQSSENFSGKYFATVAAEVTERPVPGSDEIEKAFDECWVGKDGYVKKDGSRQKRAIAFQGHVRTTVGALITEVFIADIPNDITVGGSHPLEGTARSRPGVPRNLKQRRLTFTGTKKYPGIQGPRCWLRSSPDGTLIYFLMKDDNGIVQVFGVHTANGEVRQVTSLPFSVQDQINLNSDGSMLTFLCDNSVWVASTETIWSRRMTPRTEQDNIVIGPVHWNKEGNMLVFNQFVEHQQAKFLQVFKLTYTKD